MIGKLRGKVDTIYADRVIIDVGGVGYIAFASARALEQLQGLTGEVSLVIETHVREDHIHLYGFLSEMERDSFLLLTSVQGVGAKHGLAILSALSPEEITTAIMAQDVTSMTRAHGVGKKLAERITNELKSKIGSLPSAIAAPNVNAQKKSPATAPATGATSAIRDDAVSALEHLGYARMDAFQAVARILQDDADAGLDTVITRSLRELAA